MGQVKLSAMEIDAIGEILNISLGASATAVSIMLDARVDITTPKVSVQARDEFEFSNIKPAVCVEITYVEGLEGKNIMLLKRQDVKAIIEMLMGMDIPDEEFVLDEMNISAICEVMNQMMGASATALSELLDMPVNISTPKPHEVDSVEEFKEEFFARRRRNGGHPLRPQDRRQDAERIPQRDADQAGEEARIRLPCRNGRDA